MQDEAITIDFTAGYGDSWNDVPEPIRTAIGLRVQELWDGCRSGHVDALAGGWCGWLRRGRLSWDEW
jgi:hypothetical protein